MKKILYFTVVLFLFFSCSGNSKNDAKNTNQTVDNDVVESVTTKQEIELLPLPKDSILKNITFNNFSYTVYIPQNTDIKNADILLVFDPHASGLLPVEKYQKLASENNIVLIASNNSENSLPSNQYQEILSNITDFTGKHFRKNTISALGFSGGGKVASLLLENTKLDNIITAGAGLSKEIMQQKIVLPKYLSFVGKYDFNYPGLFYQQKQFKENALNTFLYVFNGKHEWPDSRFMQYAFYMIKLSALKKQGKNRQIRDLTSKIKSELYPAGKEKDILIKKQKLDLLVFLLDEYTDVSSFKNELDEIISSDSYKLKMKELNAMFQKENTLKQNYAQAISAKDVDWWKSEIENLNKKAKTKNIDAEIYTRLINYLSLVCYMYVDNSLKNNYKGQARHFLEIYKIIDPENPDVQKFQKQLQ